MTMARAEESHVTQEPCSWSCELYPGSDLGNDGAAAAAYADCVARNGGDHDGALARAQQCFKDGPFCLSLEQHGDEPCQDQIRTCVGNPVPRIMNGAAIGCVVGIGISLLFGAKIGFIAASAVTGTVAGAVIGSAVTTKC